MNETQLAEVSSFKYLSVVISAEESRYEEVRARTGLDNVGKTRCKLLWKKQQHFRSICNSRALCRSH